MGSSPRREINVAVGGRGLAGVAKRSEELASQRTNFGLRKFTSEFRWEGGKPKAENAIYLRVLGDDIIMNTQMHRGVPLPENKFFFGVCRKAFPITPEGAESKFCHVCDVLNPAFEGDQKQKKRNGLVPVDVAIALAVEQEVVVIERKINYKTKMVEFEIPQTTDEEKKGTATVEAKEYRALLDKLGPPGTKVNIPHFGLLVGTISGQQALFDWPSRRQSISDRVFEVSRTGKGLETKWDWDHEGPLPDDQIDPTPLLAEYAAKYPFELPEEWVYRNGSEERYNHFFKLGGPAGDGSEPAAGEPDDNEPVADSRAALMERLKGNGGNK